MAEKNNEKTMNEKGRDFAARTPFAFLAGMIQRAVQKIREIFNIARYGDADGPVQWVDMTKEEIDRANAAGNKKEEQKTAEPEAAEAGGQAHGKLSPEQVKALNEAIAKEYPGGNISATVNGDDVALYDAGAGRLAVIKDGAAALAEKGTEAKTKAAGQIAAALKALSPDGNDAASFAAAVAIVNDFGVQNGDKSPTRLCSYCESVKKYVDIETGGDGLKVNGKGIDIDNGEKTVSRCVCNAVKVAEEREQSFKMGEHEIVFTRNSVTPCEVSVSVDGDAIGQYAIENDGDAAKLAKSLAEAGMPTEGRNSARAAAATVAICSNHGIRPFGEGGRWHDMAAGEKEKGKAFLNLKMEGNGLSVQGVFPKGRHKWETADMVKVTASTPAQSVAAAMSGLCLDIERSRRFQKTDARQFRHGVRPLDDADVIRKNMAGIDTLDVRAELEKVFNDPDYKDALEKEHVANAERLKTLMDGAKGSPEMLDAVISGLRGELDALPSQFQETLDAQAKWAKENCPMLQCLGDGELEGILKSACNDFYAKEEKMLGDALADLEKARDGMQVQQDREPEKTDGGRAGQEKEEHAKKDRGKENDVEKAREKEGNEKTGKVEEEKIKTAKPEQPGKDMENKGGKVEKGERQAGKRDEYFDRAARLFITKGKGSAGMLQRNLRIGFTRADGIMKQLEEAGVAGPAGDGYVWTVKMGLEEYESLTKNPENTVDEREGEQEVSEDGKELVREDGLTDAEAVMKSIYGDNVPEQENEMEQEDRAGQPERKALDEEWSL